MSLHLNTYHPFPGLKPYSFKEREYFSGRDRQKYQMLKILSDSNFAAVIGSNGVGKTSFVNSEIVPELLKGFVVKGVKSWKVAAFRPGKSPLASLATALSRVDIIRSSEDDKIDPNLSDKFESILREKKYGIIEIIERHHLTRNHNLLLYIDHLDDLLFYSDYQSSESSKKEVKLFIDRLVEVINQSAYPVTVITTLRTEMAGHFSRFPDLAEAINKNQFLLGDFEPGDLLQIFEKTAKEGVIGFDKELLQHIAEFYKSNPLVLGEFQHAMKRCVDIWYEKGGKGSIGLEHLNAAGGLDNSISHQLNDTFGYMAREHKATSRLLFQAITETSPTGRVFSVPRSIREIATIINRTPDEVVVVAKFFTHPSCGVIKVLDAQDITGRLEHLDHILDKSENKVTTWSEITISQEFVLSGWPRLDKWIKEEHLNSNVYKNIARDVARNEPPYEGEKLLSTWKWYESVNPHPGWAERYHPGFSRVKEFLLESKSRYDREQDRRIAEEWSRQQKAKRNRNAKILFSAVAIVLMLVAIYKTEEATSDRRLADKAMLKADSAMKEADTAREIATKLRQKAEQSRIEAQMNEELAKEAKKLASEEKEEAEKAQRKAELAAIRAEELGKRAERLSMDVKEKNRQIADAKVEITEAKILEDYLGILERVRDYSDDAIKILRPPNDEKQKKAAAELASRGYQEFLKTRAERYRNIQDTIMAHTQKKLFSALTLAYQKIGGSRQLDHIHYGIAISKNKTVNAENGDGEFLIGTNDENAVIYKVVVKNGSVLSADKISTVSDPDKKIKGIKKISYSGSGNHFMVSHTPVDQVNRFLSRYDADGNIIATENMEKLIEVIYPYGEDHFIVADQYNLYFIDGQQSNSSRKPIYKSTGILKAMDFHEPGKQLFLARENRNVVLLEITRNNAREISTFKLDEFDTEITAITYVASKNWIIAGNRSGEIYIYDAISKECIFKSLHEHSGSINCFALSSDEKILVSGGRDKNVNIWNLDQLGSYTAGNQNHENDYQPVVFSESESIRAVSFVDNNWIIVVYSTEGLSSGRGGVSLLPLDLDITGRELETLVNGNAGWLTEM